MAGDETLKERSRARSAKVTGFKDQARDAWSNVWEIPSTVTRRLKAQVLLFTTRLSASNMSLLLKPQSRFCFYQCIASGGRCSTSSTRSPSLMTSCLMTSAILLLKSVKSSGSSRRSSWTSRLYVAGRHGVGYLSWYSSSKGCMTSLMGSPMRIVTLWPGRGIGRGNPRSSFITSWKPVRVRAFVRSSVSCQAQYNYRTREMQGGHELRTSDVDRNDPRRFFSSPPSFALHQDPADAPFEPPEVQQVVLFYPPFREQVNLGVRVRASSSSSATRCERTRWTRPRPRLTHRP